MKNFNVFRDKIAALKNKLYVRVLFGGIFSSFVLTILIIKIFFMLDSLVFILSLMEKVPLLHSMEGVGTSFYMKAGVETPFYMMAGEVPPSPGPPPPERYPMLYHPHRLREMGLGHLVVPNRELGSGMPFSWSLSFYHIDRGFRELDILIYGEPMPPLGVPGVPPIL